MAAKKENPRKKALDAISRKIALFMVQETYNDEEDARLHLNNAAAELDKAAALLVEADEKAEAAEQAEGYTP